MNITEKRFQEEEGDHEVLISKNIMPTLKEFNLVVENDGKVSKTPVDSIIYLIKMLE